ncbi:nucleoside diphosphate-linked moiety X motif 8 [Danio aesculapii]|uniref:nucleoside diphosphate-linked moiety X motif 8 n=1 Tax=Danio aesculapii TaxID=1142201 RepID=UPI0024C08434|nr:nucleoside diphosphate-linked moiety X motif 8 [Danio aesculapii]
MFRTPHVKACVNLLRIHRLSLRDAQIHLQHRCFCSRSALTPPHRGVSAGSDSSERVRISISTRFLLARMNFSCVHSTNSVLLFAHRSLSASPSALSTIVSPPEGCTRRHTHRCGLNQQSCVSISAGLWTRSVCAESRPAVFALQSRSLHTNTQFEECVSALNEARCRRTLQANAALYERDTHRWAAVLVCLCVSHGDPALLFTLRSAQLKGRHKGDVSFAGGKKDPSDRTVVDTALREAAEELGIHIPEEKVWGVLKPLRDKSGMMIAPVIANIGPLEALSFQPNPSEVEEIFTLTLEHLCEPQNRGYTHFRTGEHYGYTLPVFLSPKHRVWGLTAVALDQALKLIVPPERMPERRVIQQQRDAS